MMRKTYTLDGLNREALNAQLLDLLGITYGGFADQQVGGGFRVTVFFSSAVNDFTELDALMAMHDPNQLTADQQARQTRQQKLIAARRDLQGADLDPVDYAGENALIQTLARKIAWLEQEVVSLRTE